MGRSRYHVVEGGNTYFVTSSLIRWIPLFSIPECAQIFIDSLNWLSRQEHVGLYAWVLMENHTHLIISSPTLSTDMKRMKSYTARRIVDHLKVCGPHFWLREMSAGKKAHKLDQSYQVWQEGFHPKQMTSIEQFTQKVEYIHNNPMKRGYVDAPEHWRYSSCRDYFGGEGLVEISRIIS